MNKLSKQDYILITNLKKNLKEKFGDLIDRIYCYGSRVYAQKQDADFDILIITSRKIDWRERDKIFDIIFDYELENNIDIDPKYFSKEEFYFVHEQMPFIKNVKSYGIVI